MILRVLTVRCIKNKDSNEFKNFNKRLLQRRCNLKKMLKNKLTEFDDFHAKFIDAGVKQHDVNICMNEIKLLSSSIQSLDKSILNSKSVETLLSPEDDDML